MTNTLLKKFIDTGMDVDLTQSDGTERKLMKKGLYAIFYWFYMVR
ncbi:MAG: hypothetical protein ACRD5J_02910 [Nitrososphaeraceae archaeon]